MDGKGRARKDWGEMEMVLLLLLLANDYGKAVW